jgi:AcrR family transcriptional regulator
MSSSVPPSITFRKRALLRRELSQAAAELLIGQGYDDTTMDDVAAAAGCSKRTLFRYFATKEDVFIDMLVELGTQMRTVLEARPPGERPAAALRHAILSVSELDAEHVSGALELARLTFSSPPLYGRYLQRQVEWKAGLTEELARRVGLDPTLDFRPALAVAVSLAAFDTAVSQWIRSRETRSLAELVDQALRLVAPTMNAARA